MDSGSPPGFVKWLTGRIVKSCDQYLEIRFCSRGTLFYYSTIQPIDNLTNLRPTFEYPPALHGALGYREHKFDGLVKSPLYVFVTQDAVSFRCLTTTYCIQTI